MKGFILGATLIVIGIAIIYRHRDLYKTFGDIERAEKAFGNSLIVYPLTGVVMIVLGVLFFFGFGSNPENIDSVLEG